MKKPSRKSIVMSVLAVASVAMPLSAIGYGSPMPGTPFMGFPENFPDPNHLICKHAKKSHAHLPDVSNNEAPHTSEEMRVSTPQGSELQPPNMSNGGAGQGGGQGGGGAAPENREGAQGYLFQPSPGPMMTPIVGIHRPTPAQRISSLGTAVNAAFAALSHSVR